MQYDGDPQFADVDAQWIIDGPNSGGVRLWVLWRAHLFLVEREWSSESISQGIPAALFAARYRNDDDPRYRQILADLEARALA